MPTPRVIGPWDIRDLIHKGHNATVYSAQRSAQGPGHGQLVALKVCNARRPVERYQRFQDEVEFLRRTADPGVLPLLDAYAPPHLKRTERGWLATPMATPMVDALQGAALGATVAAIADVTGTLGRLAAMGVHHRDIKPDNLFSLEAQP